MSEREHAVNGRTAPSFAPAVAVHNPLEPEAHARRYFYGAILRVLSRLVSRHGGWKALFNEHPLLLEYNNELAENGLAGRAVGDALASWWSDLEARERATPAHLPLRALRAAAGIEHGDLLLVALAHLVDEDARFAPLIERVMNAPGQHRPTRALLEDWMGEDRAVFEARLVRLADVGVLIPMEHSGPRGAQTFGTPADLWDAWHGAVSGPFARGWRPAAAATSLDALTLPDEVREAVERVVAIGRERPGLLVVVRGAPANGRRTLLAAIARDLGFGTLRVPAGETRSEGVAVRAALWNALPIFIADLAPGERATLPPLAAWDAPAGVALGPWGGLEGEAIARAAVIELPMPDAAARARLWSEALPGCDGAALANAHRVPAGRLRRLAEVASTQARLAGRERATLGDVRSATRLFGRELLETLATRVEVPADWSGLVLDAHTSRELRLLEARCRDREALREQWGAGKSGRPGVGVRALLTGPSGTGKSRAAACLAGVLGKDLYRADPSAIIDRYIGESEKRLHALLGAAEQLDVPLLIDECDSLLAPRTGVSSSTDRYANLETNFLLQRLESFEGIVFFATNAGTADRIDRAYERRMEAVIPFRAPGPAERRAIWRLYLPATPVLDASFLDEVSHRCELTGAQILQAVQHAMLASRYAGGDFTEPLLEDAVRREYRKQGASCPLRRVTAGA